MINQNISFKKKIIDKILQTDGTLKVTEVHRIICKYICYGMALIISGMNT